MRSSSALTKRFERGLFGSIQWLQSMMYCAAALYSRMNLKFEAPPPMTEKMPLTGTRCWWIERASSVYSFR